MPQREIAYGRSISNPEDERGTAFGGGVAFWNDRLFVSTGYAQVLALDPADGKVIWRSSVGAPVHSAPTVSDGRVFVVTVENELAVLAADDGRRLWVHNGIPETASLLGSASPAVEGEVVVVAYSSGELYALHGRDRPAAMVRQSGLDPQRQRGLCPRRYPRAAGHRPWPGLCRQP